MRRHRLIKTRINKSTLDAGKAMRKTMLKYKSHQAANVLEVDNERATPPCLVLAAGAFRPAVRMM
ncbi:hypothetical protein D3C78_1735620 [compost metagenome]